MTGYISEEFIIDEYLKILSKVSFLKGNKRKQIEDLLKKLRTEDILSKKLDYAKKIWKILLKSSLSYLGNELEGIEEIEKYQENFVKFEEILYGSDPYYRDHTFHTLWVYLLGDYLIRQSIKYEGIESSLRKITPESLVVLREKNEAIWCFLALTHDLGYPLEKIENINTQIQKMLPILESGKNIQSLIEFSRREELLLDHILKILSSSLDEERKGEYHFIISDSRFFQYSKELQTHNHGIMSCFILMKILNYFRKFPFSSDVGIMHKYDLTKGDTLEDAINQVVAPYEIFQAIGNHCFKDKGHSRFNTFPFLLLLTDEIEEFSRYTRAGMLRYIEEELCNVHIHNFNGKLIHIELNYNGKQFDKMTIKKFFKTKYKYFNKVIQKDPNNNINLKFDISIDNLKYSFENIKGDIKTFRNDKRIPPSKI